MEIFNNTLKKNFLSLMDVRIKLGLLTFVLALILSSNNFLFLGIMAILSFNLFLTMKISFKKVFFRFLHSLFIISVLILIKIFFSSGVVNFSFKIFGFQIRGYEAGFYEGLIIASRIICSYLVVSLFIFSTSFTEFLAALSYFKIPEIIKDVLIFAFRYILVFFSDATTIYNAQKNRLGYVNFKKSLKSFGVLITALIIKSFDYSQTITLAMEQRGYGGSIPSLKQKPLKLFHLILAIFILIVLGILWKI